MDQDSHLATSDRPGSDETPGHGAHFAARRQVIKGVIGLPAIVTLASSGTASAASVLNCALASRPSDGVNFGVQDPPNANAFKAKGEATECPAPREVPLGASDASTDAFDCGDGTAVRKEGIASGNNIYYVDPDGTGGVDPVAVLASCYASFLTIP